MMRSIAAALALLSVAHAAETVDQSQGSFDASRGVYGVGGDQNERWAQTFTAGVTAPLVALRLPLGTCGGGDLVIAIETTGADGKPSGTALGTTRIAASAAPVGVAAFNEFRLAAPVALTSGVAYAFTLRMDPDGLRSACSIAQSPPGELYARGSVFYGSRSHPLGWTDLATTPDLTRDLAFETVVDTPPPAPPRAAGDCFIPGFGAASAIPSNAPVCRCLRDEGLREFRCALLHPDFFMVRRFPAPLIPEKPFSETWEFYAVAPLDGAVRMTLTGGGLSKPVTHAFGAKKTPGKLSSPERFVVKAVAPAAAASVSGIASFDYPMKDAATDYQRTFGMDRTIAAEPMLRGE